MRMPLVRPEEKLTRDGENMVILITAAFVLLAVYQVPKLIKRKHWSDLTVFGVLALTAYALCVALALGIEITSPAEAIKDALNALNLHY